MRKIAWFVILAGIVAAGNAVLAQEEAAAPSAPAVVGAAPVPPGLKVPLPLVVYGNCEDEGEQHFIPSGWMGSYDAIEFDDCWKENPRSGSSCIRISFNDPRGWGGIAWQNPANNWGDEEGGIDLTGAKKLTFWARGDKGGEMVEFKMGIIPRNKPYFDTGKASLGRVRLEKEWKKFEIPLEGKDLSRIITGFVFAVKGRSEPIVFYLDDIIYE